MTGLILAANRVMPLGVSSPYGHLQVVYGGLELEVQAPTQLNPFAGNWAFSPAPTAHNIFSPSGNIVNYAAVTLDIGARVAGDVWDILVKVNEQYERAGIGLPYDFYFNSNSYVNTILSVVGLDAAATSLSLWLDSGFLGFPGVHSDALSTQGAFIDLTLDGGSSGDIINTGLGDDTLSGNAGNDTLSGGGGDDTISGGTDDDVLYGGDGADSLLGGDGNDSLDGGDQIDTLDGGFGNDTLDGGDGADYLVGGRGDDLIFFDDQDVLVNGGDDRDVAIYLDNSPLDFDAIENEIEVVVAGFGDDTLSADGSIETYLAGLDGNDTFNIDGGGGAPSIIWGGDGADTINITATDPGNPDAHDPIGIMVVNVGNLTAANFQDFDLSQITGVGAGFDWSEIDVVVLNPESIDRLLIDGSEVTVSNTSIDIEYFTDANGPQLLNSHPYVEASSIGSDPNAGPWWYGQGSLTDFYDISFLGGSITQAYSPAAQIGYWQVEAQLEQDPDSGHLGEWYVGDVDLHDPNDPADDEYFKNYNFESDYGINFSGDDFTSPQHVYVESETVSHFWIAISADTDGDGFDASNWSAGAATHAGAFGVQQISDLGTFASPANMGPWFAVGGYFDETTGLVSGGAGGTLTAIMPKDAGTGATDLSSGGQQSIIQNFNPTINVAVLNGGPINPNAPGGQITLAQNGSDTEIRDNGALLATLVGVSLASWQSAAAAQSLGSSSSDVITGTSAANLLASGAGNDTITAGAGDDTILYTSGNDVIVGNGTKNTGLDTLDLSKYSASQVSFTINASHDVLITTPDGVIELDYQIRYDLGHARSNIESIVFSDGSLDEAGIRARALADQSTTGSDSIQGSIVGDLILDGAGNDTIVAAGGDDTIIYASGNDLIDGHGTFNGGNDTLDLSNYLASEVTFDVSSYDVLITTPDGVVELDYQVRYDIGHARSNIENALFSDGSLDEAGIRARAVADQATTGNDTVSGTTFADRVAGGLGADILSGNAGSDTFVFSVGDGDDQITDFMLGTDLIEFAGLTFTDLAITQAGSNTLIDYGASDSLLLLGIDNTALTQSDFVFV